MSKVPPIDVQAAPGVKKHAADPIVRFSVVLTESLQKRIDEVVMDRMTATRTPYTKSDFVREAIQKALDEAQYGPGSAKQKEGKK